MGFLKKMLGMKVFLILCLSVLSYSNHNQNSKSSFISTQNPISLHLHGVDLLEVLSINLDLSVVRAVSMEVFLTILPLTIVPLTLPLSVEAEEWVVLLLQEKVALTTVMMRRRLRMRL